MLTTTRLIAVAKLSAHSLRSLVMHSVRSARFYYVAAFIFGSLIAALIAGPSAFAANVPTSMTPHASPSSDALQ
jgi:hypothetical protein